MFWKASNWVLDHWAASLSTNHVTPWVQGGGREFVEEGVLVPYREHHADDSGLSGGAHKHGVEFHDAALTTDGVFRKRVEVEPR